MLDMVKEIIVKWDPIGLMEFAPPDEYDDECLLICEKVKQKSESLGKIIYDIFIDSFGEAFREDLSKCMEVGAEIESKMIPN